MIGTMTNGGARRTRRSRHPVKLTALLYLKEALVREQYEKCAELVATWPAWKRDCLSRPATEEIAEEFDTADPCVIVDCRGPSPAD